MKKNILAAILLIGILFVSGCISPGNGDTATNGDAITNGGEAVNGDSPQEEYDPVFSAFVDKINDCSPAEYRIPETFGVEIVLLIEGPSDNKCVLLFAEKENDVIIQEMGRARIPLTETSKAPRDYSTFSEEFIKPYFEPLE